MLHCRSFVCLLSAQFSPSKLPGPVRFFLLAYNATRHSSARNALVRFQGVALNKAVQPSVSPHHVRFHNRLYAIHAAPCTTSSGTDRRQWTCTPGLDGQPTRCGCAATVQRGVVHMQVVASAAASQRRDPWRRERSSGGLPHIRGRHDPRSAHADLPAGGCGVAAALRCPALCRILHRPGGFRQITARVRHGEPSAHQVADFVAQHRFIAIAGGGGGGGGNNRGDGPQEEEEALTGRVRAVGCVGAHAANARARMRDAVKPTQEDGIATYRPLGTC